jgi:hypothetical protein
MLDLTPEEIEEALRDPSNNSEVTADRKAEDCKVKTPQVVAAWLAWCSWFVDEEEP